MQYFFAIGLKAPYEAYTGQPAQEITPRSGADRRDWIIGTPEDAIAQIERMTLRLERITNRLRRETAP